MGRGQSERGLMRAKENDPLPFLPSSGDMELVVRIPGFYF